jgi:hypothetical protein
MKEVSKMGLKNSAHFIGIIRGNFIELRDYDDIQDLKDGTKIIIFTPTLEEQKAFKKLIAMFEGLTQSKLQSEINRFERIPNFFEPDFLKNLGMSRQTRITKKFGKNEILLKKYRTQVVSPKKHLQSRKIPMTSKK